MKSSNKLLNGFLHESLFDSKLNRFDLTKLAIKNKFLNSTDSFFDSVFRYSDENGFDVYTCVYYDLGLKKYKLLHVKVSGDCVTAVFRKLKGEYNNLRDALAFIQSKKVEL